MNDLHYKYTWKKLQHQVFSILNKDFDIEVANYDFGLFNFYLRDFCMLHVIFDPENLKFDYHCQIYTL